MKKYVDYLIKSIFAGIMIGIAGTVYLRVDNNIVGSFLFSIGLLVICMYGMNLYTGKVGYILINKFNYIYELLITIAGNFIGTFLVAKLVLLTRFRDVSDKALEIVNLKLNDNLLSIFILSILCGVLMYIAVNNYKKINNEIGKYSCIFMCVMVFILCGFEHSVANMYYISVANLLSLKSLLYILIMILGNSVGSILVALYYNRFYKN
ncbi:MAG: formate/nitrite transporter family protein [Bacilli bacterium]